MGESKAVRIHKVKYCEEKSYAERKRQRYKAGLGLISTHNYPERISGKEQAEKSPNFTSSSE